MDLTQVGLSQLQFQYQTMCSVYTSRSTKLLIIQFQWTMS